MNSKIPTIADLVNNADAPAWPTPEPLVSKIDPQPYPVDALPAVVRAAVEEVQGFTKAPMPLVASCALSALSLATQAHYDVTRANGLSGPVSLFLLTIADSGERKTTTDGFFTRALVDYERMATEKAASLLKEYAANNEAWEAKRAGIKEEIRRLAKEGKATEDRERAMRDLEDAKPFAPRVPKLLYGDVTPEELARSINRRWPSGGVISAEAGVVFGSHGMGKESATRNLALLNVLWDGGRLVVDRKTTESFTVEGARLTVGLQVREATLRAFLETTGVLARGTGFLTRFLVAWPESTMGARMFAAAPSPFGCP
jgi:putative DNA primase/helicase